MDRQKSFKQILSRNINNNMNSKNNNLINNINMNFKDFKGAQSFNVKIKEMKINEKEQLEKLITHSKDNKNYFFEWTDYKSSVKPFYDIDVWFDNKKDYEAYVNAIRFEVCDVLNKFYPDGNLIISSSNGEKTKKGVDGYAISYHILVNNYECSVEQLRKFNEDNKLYDIYFKDFPKIKMFDKNVYRNGGNMRAIFSYKPIGLDPSQRQKIPVNNKDDYQLTNHIIQSSPFTNKEFLQLPSPASSPPASPNGTDEEEEEQIEFTIQPIVNNYDIKELKDILNILGDDCYEYETFIKIGMALNNITQADDIGKGLFINWAKKDEDNFDLIFINTNWKYWEKQKKEKKLGMTFLKKLKEQYEPKNKKTLEQIFLSSLKNAENGEGRTQAKIQMLKEMNKRLIYISETSNFVVPTHQTIIDYNDEGEMVSTKEKETYNVKPLKDVKLDFQKENFEYSFVDDEGKNKTIKYNPLNEWLEWEDRCEKEKINFDPNNRENPFIFNIWSGYNIKKEDCENFDEASAQPMLDHIKRIWCKDNDENYEYVINYLAHIIQKPYKKTGVCLALHSKQGAGKGVVLKLLENIIGDNHYSQNSNAERVFGKFNGLLEAKTLINLDEAFWGGDKKLEGQIKNQITETTQTIEKKSLNSYNINDYCNYIITTNNDWFAGVDEEDRRYFCLELSNEFSGRDTDKKVEYFNNIRKVETEAFAKVLYNMDLSSFNPRKFKKTKLLQEQVERNWCSPKVWWNDVVKEGGFNYKGSFIEWGKTLSVDEGTHYSNYGIVIKNKKKEKMVVYDKDWIFNVYDSQSYDGRKFAKSTFWKEMQTNCLGDLYKEERIQKKKERKLYVFLPSLDEAREKWYDQQDFDYQYNVEQKDEWACDSDSDDEF
jgi:hypothetical protein